MHLLPVYDVTATRNDFKHVHEIRMKRISVFKVLDSVHKETEALALWKFSSLQLPDLFRLTINSNITNPEDTC